MEVVWFGASNNFADLGRITLSLRHLGVIFDSDLKFEKQINSVVKSCFYHLSHFCPCMILKKSFMHLYLQA